MAISALQALEDHRYTYFGYQVKDGKNIPMVAYSDNLVEWSEVSRLDSINGMKDLNVTKIDEYYYVIGTGGFYKTKDFISFEKLDYLDKGANKDLLAPELFQDNSGNFHIVYSAGDVKNGLLNIFVADFDPTLDRIKNQGQEVSYTSDAIDNPYKSDPSVVSIDGIYFLLIGGNYVLSSDNYLGPYQKFPVNFAPTPRNFGEHSSSINGWVEGPQMLIDGDSVRLFADQAEGNGLVFRSATVNDMFDWTDTEKTHSSFKMRQGSIVVNDKVTAFDTTELDDTPKFDSNVSIQGLHAKEPVPLTCFLNNSFQYQYEDNQTNQITFVAYNDGSPSFAYIANESTINFNNDLFIIKNVEEDDTGSELYTVTALQYVNSEIGRVRQRNIRNGVLTYTINDVLNFFLNDKAANPFGFSFRTFGDFDKQRIENLGGCSGKEMISKIIETWPGTIIHPQGKTLNVFAPDVFHKNYQRKIVYKFSSSNMKLIEDSTGIVNQVRAIGATKESDQTDTTSGGASEQLTEGTETIVTGQDNTSTFQNDAKKYLGVPYVWGGHNKANPWAGMDCSGYVSQVYHDFGIEIPVNTRAMEHNFREIPRSEIKPGDVGFYGPHGDTHHICLILDRNTQIYEPQPGQSCKTATIDSFPPSWYGRNDQMQAKINTKKVETVPTATLSFHDDYSSSSTSTQTSEEYYFQPFIVQDDRSIEMWGLHPGDDVQDDRFKDAQSMKDYAIKQLVSDPVITVEIVMDSNVVPVPGEQAYLTIPERGTLVGNSDQTTQNAYNTQVTVVGFTWCPFDPSQGTDITYDNLQASILHSQKFNADLHRIEELANAALDRMPQIFYSKEDPSANQNVRNGAIWVKPITRESEVNNNAGHSQNNTSRAQK